MIILVSSDVPAQKAALPSGQMNSLVVVLLNSSEVSVQVQSKLRYERIQREHS